jgi:hypothetical protein
MQYAQIGTVSHGTLRNEDLIETFTGELTHYLGKHHNDLGHAEVQCFTRLLREAQMYRDGLNDNPDYACELVQDLSDALNRFAAPNCYFGAHEGDGSDFGFWPADDGADDWHQPEFMGDGGWGH